jgi:hypothetical protein
MNCNFKSLPIPYHKTLEVIDTTKLKTFCDCPRKFLFEYAIGWRSEYPSNHLVFGEAWHRALAQIYVTNFSTTSIMDAYENYFLPYYRNTFPPTTDELFGGKTPENALLALIQYAEKYKSDFLKYKVLFAEVAGSAFVTDTQEIFFRIDLVLEDDENRIFAGEHKTGGKMFYSWPDQWLLDLQPGTYTHALRSYFADKEVRGVLMNGTFFQQLKKGPKIEFNRVPVWKTNEQMLYWLTTVNSIISEIEANFNFLETEKPSDNVLRSFRMNPGNCTKYSGCPYRDFCEVWPNPLNKLDSVPNGFAINHWDPREVEARHKINV